MGASISGQLRDQLGEAIGKERVHSDETLLRDRRFDYWVLNHLRDWRGDELAMPGLVVQPETVAQVQSVVRIARQSGTPLVLMAVLPSDIGRPSRRSASPSEHSLHVVARSVSPHAVARCPAMSGITSRTAPSSGPRPQ